MKLLPRAFLLFLPALAAALAPVSSHAVEPLDASGRIFGIEPGTYEGGGTLASQNWLPNAKYATTRKLGDSLIEAHTTATILGIQVAEAGARLKVSPNGPGRFDLLDADAGDAKAGEGSCDASACSFKATVMGGNLTLEETWVATPAGFDIVRASQLYNGNPARYDGKLERRR